MPTEIIAPDANHEIETLSQHSLLNEKQTFRAQMNADVPNPRTTHQRHKEIQIRYRRFVWFASLIVAFAIVLRVWHMDRVPGINGDEAWYGVQAQQFVDKYFYGKELPPNESITLRTPTGNIWNPFFMGPRILLEAFGEPSFFKLRFPAAVFGILTLWINWRLCRRALGRQTAWNTTVMLAVLPIMIAQSRIAWDACQSVLFCLPVLYWPIEARRTGHKPLRTIIWSGVILGCAWVVHPTNLFIAPVWLCLVWPLIIPYAPIFRTHLQSHSGKWLFAALSAMVLVALLFGWHGQPQMSYVEYAKATMNPQPVFEFCNNVLSLFTGEQVYYSMSLGTPSGMTALIVKFSFVALMMPIMYLTFRTIYFAIIATSNNTRRMGRPSYGPNMTRILLSIVTGTIFGGFCFLLIGGPEVLRAGYERYGLWLVAPCVIAAGIAFQQRNQMRRKQQPRPVMTWIEIGRFQAVATLVAFMFLFQFNLEMTGGNGHQTYRTAYIEPKEQKLHTDLAKLGHVALNVDPNEGIWWDYWPIRYLSRSSVTIELGNEKRKFVPVAPLAEKND